MLKSILYDGSRAFFGVLPELDGEVINLKEKDYGKQDIRLFKGSAGVFLSKVLVDPRLAWSAYFAFKK